MSTTRGRGRRTDSVGPPIDPTVFFSRGLILNLGRFGSSLNDDPPEMEPEIDSARLMVRESGMPVDAIEGVPACSEGGGVMAVVSALTVAIVLEREREKSGEAWEGRCEMGVAARRSGWAERWVRERGQRKLEARSEPL